MCMYIFCDPRAKMIEAPKAFTAASVFDPTHLCQMSLDKVKAHLKLLINFNFITQYMIDGAIKDANTMLTYAIMNKVLPDINMLDHRIMMKMNEVKKEKALRRVKKRRHGDKAEINQGLLQEVDDGFVVLPDGILPRDADVLRNESEKVNKKAYSIMERWRFTTITDSSNIGLPRFKVFNSWGKLLSLISLCVPSSAAVERVFSLLKLCKATNKTEMLHDELEGSMLMRVNDVHV